MKLLTLSLLLLSFGWGFAASDDYQAGAITITHVWARPVTRGAPAAAVYLTMRNEGSNGDTLISVQAPLAEVAQLHQTLSEGGVMKMREAKDGIAVGPGSTVTFAPGGYHIMLIRPKQALALGQHFPITLNFAKAGSVEVEVGVEQQGTGANAGDQGGGMGHMH